MLVANPMSASPRRLPALSRVLLWMMRGLGSALSGLALALLGCGGPDTPPPNVVLISIDDLRPDHLGCYGRAGETSPWIDGLAREGTIFRNAFTTAPWTLPSHLSLFTSLYPSEHGINPTPTFGTSAEELPILPDRFVTLTERMRDAGYATGAFTNGHYVSGKLGFAQGFDHYFETGEQDSILYLYRAMHNWLRLQEGRFFVFLHTYQVHTPLAPPKRWRADTSTEPGGLTEVTPELLGQIEALYDAELRYADSLVGKLVRYLVAHDRLENTLIVITSDHGEEFYDHGGFGHGQTLYDEVLRVPLVIFGPGVAHGRSIDEPVSIIDVMPTLVDLLELPLDADFSGVSLRPLLGTSEGPPAVGEEPSDAPRVLYSETAARGGGIAIRRGDHKAIFHLDEGRVELYDVAHDPSERQDLVGQDPGLESEFEGLLQAYRERASPPRPSDEVLEIDDELRARLRALGYEEAD
jgi:arylsulfatase A-like enzyme